MNLKKILLVFAIAGALSDIVTTYIGLRSPLIVESNPLGVEIPIIGKFLTIAIVYLLPIYKPIIFPENYGKLLLLSAGCQWFYCAIHNIQVIIGAG